MLFSTRNLFNSDAVNAKSWLWLIKCLIASLSVMDHAEAKLSLIVASPAKHLGIGIISFYLEDLALIECRSWRVDKWIPIYRESLSFFRGFSQAFELQVIDVLPLDLFNV